MLEGNGGGHGQVSLTREPPRAGEVLEIVAGVRPELLDESFIDDVVLVDEADTIRACHRLARRGFLFGGSTGTVVSGATSWLARNGSQGTTAVAIAPDLGERYLDTVYQSNWVEDLYGAEVLNSADLSTAHRPG